jgi:hypothetical protein
VSADEQRRLQLRAYRGNLWIGVFPVCGLVLSVLGLLAGRTLARAGTPLTWLQAGFLWYGLVMFGLATLVFLTSPLRLRSRIVPYFARQIEEYGSASSAAFRRGRGLYVEIAALDARAEVLGVTPLSSFGFADDHYGQAVRWHPASEGVKTVEALRQGLDERLRAAPRVCQDLDALASVLRIAAEHEVEFALTLRLLRKDSLQAVMAMEQRQGQFW